jgi:type I restriction-modification system DNA methylase subunit
MTHSAATAATATAPAAFSELSKKLTKSLSKEEKKNGGIFFTPPACIVDIMSRIRVFEENHNRSFDTILEPSCGSGEFISALVREYPRANITGIEYNHDIYSEVSQHFSAVTNVQIHHSDFLRYTDGDSAPDLIIGNPPYYVMKKEEVSPEYYPFFDGRPNIFILFIIKSAKLLREGGVLCFVLPSSFMNSQYYDKTRKYIVCNFTILHIAKCDNGSGYLETQQETFVLMIQKRAPTTTPTTSGSGGGGGVFEKSGATIFTFNLPRLAELYAGSHSLYELGFKVSVGTVVWNQCKNILTNDGTKTRLIYSSNIEDGKFVHKTYKNTEKKAFIDKPASGGGAPMIVLNRGYGVGEYKFDYCLITPESVSSQEYLIENHLICITLADTDADAATPIAEFQRIIRSFQDSRTREFIACYCANNAMNTTELNHMLPIYDI